ncbi:MAG TPA: flavodoxin domain-containing protein [Thermoleophilaceae bacterium]|nr:flavodoxin domain-containing protein [Thermoleophilaceae bacterium]
MVNVLIAYASTHGHTAKICRRIADVLQADDLDVDVCDLGAGEGPDPGQHDGVIVAASVHRGTHQPEVISWVRRHQPGLADKPTAFVSVSLTAAEDTDESRTVTQGLIDSFTAETGWTPGHATGMAGALQYLEYDYFTRILMRLLMRHGGHPTDASQDYDYTDWDAVEDFAHEFADTVRQAERT